ncbi:MAG TPA: MFS transporter [Vicinamibacteria bacterium]|jgi:MFS family permease
MSGYRDPVTLVRGLPRPVRLLVAGTFITKLGTFILPYLSLILRREFGLGPRAVAALMFAYGLGSMVSVLAGGALTDRLGRRVTLLFSLAGSGALAVALGLTSSVSVFAPLLVLLGFVADLYRPPSSSIVGDLLPSAERATGFAALRLAINLGFAFGMAIGGLLADLSWRLLFVLDGVTTLGFAAVVYVGIPETGAPRAEAAPRGGPGPWRDPVFLRLAATSLCLAFVFVNFVTVLPLTVTLSAGYPALVYGLIIGVNGLLIAALEISVAHALRGRRRLRVAALGTMLVGLGFALSGLVLHWAWFLLMVVLWTAGEILAMPQKMAFVADWAPPEARGRYLGFYSATWSLALALNPLVCLPLHAALGDRLFWTLALVPTVPSALVLLRLDRRADRPGRLRGMSVARAQSG